MVIRSFMDASRAARTRLRDRPGTPSAPRRASQPLDEGGCDDDEERLPAGGLHGPALCLRALPCGGRRADGARAELPRRRPCAGRGRVAAPRPGAGERAVQRRCAGRRPGRERSDRGGRGQRRDLVRADVHAAGGRALEHGARLEGARESGERVHLQRRARREWGRTALLPPPHRLGNGLDHAPREGIARSGPAAARHGRAARARH